jgi:hypothetical protein
MKRRVPRSSHESTAHFHAELEQFRQEANNYNNKLPELN